MIGLQGVTLGSPVSNSVAERGRSPRHITVCQKAFDLNLGQEIDIELN
jgi:hypothetical protein